MLWSLQVKFSLKIIIIPYKLWDYNMFIPMDIFLIWISSVQSLSHVQLFATPWIAALPGLPVHHQLPEFTQTHVHRVSDAIQPSRLVPFSSCPQSLPASESFPMSQHFAWGGQNIGVSALASVLPKNTQDWCPLEWTGWISLQSKGLSRVFSNTTVQKHHFFGTQPSSKSNYTSIHDHRKNHSLE